MYLVQKKFLPSLFLSFMLILCPTQCSNSDVHLTVGYLVPKPLNRSEAEGDLVTDTKLAAFDVWIILSAVFSLLYQSS